MKKIILLIAMLTLVVSCVQPEVGYISDNITADSDNLFIPRGVFRTTPHPLYDGSSDPLEWKITGITDKTGKITNQLQEEHEIATWLKPFDPKTDTTLELALKKIQIKKTPSILINPISGEFYFTPATIKVLEDDFDVNVSVKNSKGERQLNKFVHVKLAPFNPVEFPTETRSRLQLGKADGAYDTGYTYSIFDDSDSKAKKALEGTDPYISIKKISEEPKLGVKVKMVVTDSYGLPINPSKVVFFPGGTDYLQNYHDNTIGTVVDAESTTFGLPAPPFPQHSKSFPDGPNAYLMYYLTTTDAFTVDKAAFEAANGVKNWAPYTDANGNIRNRAYIRWGIKVNDTGTWEIKMKIPFTKRK